MKRQEILQCADAGSRYCPCHLAYTGNCIKCSLLRGEKTCNCSWQGTCIYNEVKSLGDRGVCQREDYLCDMVSMEEIDESVYLIKIAVPKFMVNDLALPGAYVMLKSKDKNSSIFNTPISVMNVDKENSILEVVIKLVGIKTKPIVNYDKVWVKGVYLNGILGTKDIKQCSNHACALVMSGLSQVNSINVISTLVKNHNRVEIFLDSKFVVLDEIVEKISALGANLHIVDIEEDEEIIKDYLERENAELVYSAGCNTFNKKVMKIVDSVSEDIRLCVSNNNLICCGEGICGSCTVKINGERIKSCKAQINSRVFLNSL